MQICFASIIYPGFKRQSSPLKKLGFTWCRIMLGKLVQQRIYRFRILSIDFYRYKHQQSRLDWWPFTWKFTSCEMSHSLLDQHIYLFFFNPEDTGIINILICSTLISALIPLQPQIEGTVTFSMQLLQLQCYKYLEQI